MPPLITREEALALSALSDPQDIEPLVERAWRVRVERFHDSTDLCASGGCGDGCGKLIERSRAAEEAGAHRFCLTAGADDFDALLDGARIVAEHTDLKRCASTGPVGRDQARRLRRAGVQRVHLAAGPSSAEAIAAVRDAGLETCLGLALDPAEPAEQRLARVFELGAIDPTSVLMALPEAPATGAGRDAAWDAVKWIAIVRLVLPGTLLRLRGDRDATFGALEPLAVRAGLNGAVIGSAGDRASFEALGLNTARQPDNGSRPRPDNRSGWMLGETPDIVGEYLEQAAPRPGGIKIRLWEPAAMPAIVARRLADAA